MLVSNTLLAGGAIGARMASSTCTSWILTAVGLATAIPRGPRMEMLPVTHIQASARAKQMLLVCVTRAFQSHLHCHLE